ncbi:hypothetical protein FOA52_005203 [Chlamydomonas sp. UWO 241]|nr:hypothetical protein FOA52_005203 [Chlamydomonas sp. UWO 241]
MAPMRLSTTLLLSCGVLLALVAGGDAGKKPSIAIVDEKFFHLEVVAGVMHVLSPYADSTTVFLHPLNFPSRPVDYGFMDLFERSDVTLRALPVLSIPHYDIMIFISPEYRVDYVRELIDKSRPKAVVAWVHNGDSRGALHMPQLHPNTHVFTLSPHVSKYVGNVLQMDVPWVLPLLGLDPVDPCDNARLTECLSGFAIQGNMDSRRRNYTVIWEEMESLLKASEKLRSDPRFVINVVGSGDPKKLLCPETLCPIDAVGKLAGGSSGIQRVVPNVGLRFLDFYSLIYRSFALIPTIASDAYFDRKFSSTVITSLVTGTPAIVTPQFLEAYTFLDESTVFLRTENQTDLDIAQRVLKMGASELAAARERV